MDQYLRSALSILTLAIAVLGSVSPGSANPISQGIASWYGPGLSGNYTASGEIFNPSQLTAAHPDLPFGTLVRVSNLQNGRSVVVRINDRLSHGSRVIDLSTAAAQVLDVIHTGVALVKVEVLEQVR